MTKPGYSKHAIGKIEHKHPCICFAAVLNNLIDVRLEETLMKVEVKAFTLLLTVVVVPYIVASVVDRRHSQSPEGP